MNSALPSRRSFRPRNYMGNAGAIAPVCRTRKPAGRRGRRDRRAADLGRAYLGMALVGAAALVSLAIAVPFLILVAQGL